MVVCLYNPAPPRYLHEALERRTTVERVVDYAGSVAPDATRIIVYSTTDPGPLPEGWEFRTGAPLSQRGLIDLLASVTSDAATEILFAFFDQPFLNVELTSRMLARHREYRAEYTFADGYPGGLAPEIVSGRAIAHLQQMASEETPVERGGLFPVVQADINRLDVETELSPTDQRLLRLSLSVDTKANLETCRRLADGAPERIDDWPAHASATRTRQRSLPRFVSVQVVERETQRLAYSPYPTMRDDVLAPGRTMDVGRFASLVEALGGFAPEAVVHLSLWGEFSLHPQALDLVRTVLARESLTLLVETSGVGWGEERTAELLAIDSDRLLLIVGLDSDDETVYEGVRGAGFAEAHRFAERAVASLGRRAYVQAVRSELTEPSLDAFYRAWKEKTPNVIIEKYDHFCGRLPQRRIGDISPIERFPCWHLQRDLYVLVDGSVPLCREDVAVGERMGNVFEEGLEACWNAGADRYAAHAAGRYGGICEACDEYYTFTF